MKQIYLGLAIHNHQPLGNFPWVFEEAYQHAYLPMVKALERHPAIRISMHYSGCLIDWLEQAHPDFFCRLAELVKRGQVEVVSGAYYEPILPSIPDADKLGQIAKMNNFVNQRFGLKPSGMWLAERVWEPHLAKSLAEAGIEWTLVDDIAFRSVGLDYKELFGYYITEEQGRSVKVFPISKQLRYSIPWHDVERVIEYLREQASEEEVRIAILGDDGEKFGVWPKTYEHCWVKQWVDRFFTTVEDNQDWLHVVPLGEFASRFLPRGGIYLPCASYDEMLEWSLPAEKSWEFTNLKHRLEAEGRAEARYLYSGLWRNFLVKYPEINRMHKKMLRVHHKVYQARALQKTNCGLEELWKAQCNCPYWHGVFGGIYLADIRASNYGHLIGAEAKAHQIMHQKQPWLEWQATDFDNDGFDELLIDGNVSSVYVSPNEGGSIFEWDIHSHSYNLMSTLARRPEAYHRVLTEPDPESKAGGGGIVPSIHDAITVKDESVSRFLVYDKYPKSSLIDHFLSCGTKLEDFASNSYQELGDFAACPYKALVKKKSGGVAVSLIRSATVKQNALAVPFEVQKVIRLSAGQEKLQVRYQLRNPGNSPVQGVFGSEWNFNLLGGGHNEQAYYRVPGVTLDDSHLDSWGELEGVEKIVLGNRHLGVELELTVLPRIKLWRFPVESVSNSEGGIEKIYQSSCLLLLMPLNLAAGGMVGLDFVWAVRPPVTTA